MIDKDRPLQCFCFVGVGIEKQNQTKRCKRNPRNETPVNTNVQQNIACEGGPKQNEEQNSGPAKTGWPVKSAWRRAQGSSTL